MTAAYLSQELGSYRDDGVTITVVESSDIPTVGVGEGTFPTIRRTLDVCGIRESDFLRECDATFKQGTKFINWRKDPAKTGENFYYHPFEPVRKINNNTDLAPYWCLSGMEKSFSRATCVQEAVSEDGRAPKNLNDPPYQGSLIYAYHLDSGKLVTLLRKRAKFARVNHIIGTVKSVQQQENGDIKSVTLENGDALTADLFIDCSGFKGLMIDGVLGSKIKPVKDSLFVDKAIVVRTAYDSEKAPIPSVTRSTAHEGGWIWDIGLRHRRGTGFVFSSDHMSDDRAFELYEKYLGDAKQTNEMRLIPMKTGYRPDAWVGNCVSIGLSHGFLEPLEATGIALIESALMILADYFPRTGNMGLARKKYNRTLTRLYETTVNFIKMHYCLSERDDSRFWKDNRDPASWSDQLKEWIETWEHGYPRDTDFESWFKLFSSDSYQFVLFGLGFQPDFSAHQSAYPFMKHAENEFDVVKRAEDRAKSMLPKNRELIEAFQHKNS